MRNFPLEVIASWPKPNYEDPTTRGDALIIVNAVFISLAVIAVILRVYARICLTQWFGADDLCIVFSLITAIGMAVCVLLANISYGWNRHVWDLPLNLIAPAYQVVYAAKIIFCLSTMFTRLSLTLFYYRLVKDSGMHAFRTVVHSTLFFHLALGITSVLILVFQCIPIKAFWTYPIIAGSRCLEEGKLTLALGVLITVADFITAALPIPMILRLKMPVRRRIGVTILLGLGFVVSIAGAIRSYFIWFSLIKTYDETWYCYGLWISAEIEVDLCVICACAPSFRLVLHEIMHRHFPGLGESVASLGSRALSRARSRTPSAATSALPIITSRTNTASEGSLWSSVYTGSPNIPTFMTTDIQHVAAGYVREGHQHFATQQQPHPEARLQTLFEQPTVSPSTIQKQITRVEGRAQSANTTSGRQSRIHITTNLDVTSALWGSDESAERGLNHYVRQQADRARRSHEHMRRLASIDRTWR